MERLRIGSFSFVAEANPRVTIAGRNGVLVCVTRTIAEMYLRCFVYMPIDEVIERKASGEEEDAELRRKVDEATAAWSARENRGPVELLASSATGDAVSVNFGQVVKIKRRAVVMNRSEFKRAHDGNEPLQRIARHHPTLMLAIPGTSPTQYEKVWLFEMFPGARRTITWASFHKINVVKDTLRSADNVYVGQALDFFDHAQEEQARDFGFNFNTPPDANNNLPDINESRAKFDLCPLVFVGGVSGVARADRKGKAARGSSYGGGDEAGDDDPDDADEASPCMRSSETVDEGVVLRIPGFCAPPAPSTHATARTSSVFFQIRARF